MLSIIGLSLVILTAEADILDDCCRFPPKECCRAAMDFNLKYQEYIEARMAVDLNNLDYYADCLREARRLYYVWDALNAAQGGEREEKSYRRLWFQVFREEMGEEAFQAGLIPPSVPVWRFTVQ